MHHTGDNAQNLLQKVLENKIISKDH